MEASDLWDSFSVLVQRLRTSVDVLNQHSENYYVMSELLESRSQFPGGKSFDLLRQRYTAHMIPMPHDLDRFGPDADVDELSAADLRKLAEVMAGVLDMVWYLSERSEFSFLRGDCQNGALRSSRFVALGVVA